ncbi:hypothetical protein SR41_18165 [Sphingomonas melonis]|uniref:Uncharacterized protein n=1 Tax=Sphingomonas melonis TaxID=152682 RepID=A0A0D1JX39_9SPHN|nr:hypothetical protein SR41_18165 [Sphingomonas melonis]
MISSGLCFFSGIRRPFLDPDCHSRWTTQKGAAQLLLMGQISTIQATLEEGSRAFDQNTSEQIGKVWAFLGSR